VRVRSGVPACVVITATLLATAAAGTAWAAPPPNDTFAGAKVISSLPFSEELDTTQATGDETDAQVESACGVGANVSASVWYAFTPSTNQIITVDTSGSDYWAVVGVVTGLPGSFSPVLCGPLDGPTFVALAGETYYLDVASLGGSGAGGTLRLSVTGESAPANLDQSFTSPTNLSASINECCAYIGQTFTAGRTGVLSGVSIDVTGWNTSLPLHVAIRAVDSAGLPTSTVLGETVLDSSSSPLTRLITFPQDIHVTAGTQYAIAANY